MHIFYRHLYFMITASGSAFMLLVILLMYKFFQPIDPYSFKEIDLTCSSHHHVQEVDYAPYEFMSWINFIRLAWYTEEIKNISCKLCHLNERLTSIQNQLVKYQN